MATDWIQGLMQGYQASQGSKGGASGGGGGLYSFGNGSVDPSSIASGTAYNVSPFDDSNWTVATGRASASATNSGPGLSSTTLLIGIAIVALVILKRK